jgi:Fe-S-cluster containining protein
MRRNLPKERKLILRHAREADKAKQRANQTWWQHVKAKYDVSCITCKESHCCYQMVLASLFEGLLLAEKLMLAEETKLLADLFNMGKMQGTLLRKFKWRPEKNEPLPDRATALWLDWQFPCPLLKDGRCSQYQLRPTSCATHASLDSPKKCGPPSGQILRMPDSLAPRLVTVAEDAAFFEKVWTDKALMMTPMPLGTAVHYGTILLAEGPQALLREARKIGSEPQKPTDPVIVQPDR